MRSHIAYQLSILGSAALFCFSSIAPAFADGCPACSFFRDERNSCVQTAEQSCTEAFTRWQQVSSHCDAYDLDVQAQGFAQTAAVAYVAAALTCFAACYAGPTGWAAGAAICSGASIAATGLDIALTISLMIEGEQFRDWMTSAGLAVKAGGIIAEASGVSLIASPSISAPCITGGIMTVAALLKRSNMGSNAENAQKECSIVQSYMSNATGSEVGGSGENASATGNTAHSTTAPSSTSGSSASKSGSTSNASVTNGIPPDGISDDVEDFPNGHFSPALADPFGKVFRNMPNAKRIPNALETLGTSLKELSKKLETQSPGAIISGVLTDAPDPLKQMLTNLDQAAKDGKITYKLGPTAITQSSSYRNGQGGTRSTSPSFHTTSPGIPIVSLQQSKPVLTDKLKTDDIWHTEWKGSIFQIVSTRINESRNRIHFLEWQTPLNRALMGLPSRRKPAGKAR